MKKKTTVTIGIPAYNEEANIGNLLNAMLKQKQDKLVLDQIIVISDGSTDNTAREVRSVNDKRIILINNSTRRGQIYCQNRIFSQSKSDIVVLLEADTEPKNSNLIKMLVAPIVKDSDVGLVQGNIAFAQPKSFIGRILYEQAAIHYRMITREKNLGEVFSSGRGGRAFSRRVYTQLYWPAHVPEDTYAVLWCIRNNIPIKFQGKSICIFRIPESISDFRRARQKTIAGRTALKKYFSAKEIRGLYSKGNKAVLVMFIKFILTKPLYCVVYLFLKFYAEIIAYNSYFSDYWEVGRSTKFVVEEEKLILRKSMKFSSSTVRL